MATNFDIIEFEDIKNSITTDKLVLTHIGVLLNVLTDNYYNDDLNCYELVKMCIIDSLLNGLSGIKKVKDSKKSYTVINNKMALLLSNYNFNVQKCEYSYLDKKLFTILGNCYYFDFNFNEITFCLRIFGIIQKKNGVMLDTSLNKIEVTSEMLCEINAYNGKIDFNTNNNIRNLYKFDEYNNGIDVKDLILCYIIKYSIEYLVENIIEINKKLNEIKSNYLISKIYKMPYILKNVFNNQNIDNNLIIKYFKEKNKTDAINKQYDKDFKIIFNQNSFKVTHANGAVYKLNDGHALDNLTILIKKDDKITQFIISKNKDEIAYIKIPKHDKNTDNTENVYKVIFLYNRDRDNKSMDKLVFTCMIYDFSNYIFETQKSEEIKNLDKKYNEIIPLINIKWFNSIIVTDEMSNTAIKTRIKKNLFNQTVLTLINSYIDNRYFMNYTENYFKHICKNLDINVSKYQDKNVFSMANMSATHFKLENLTFAIEFDLKNEYTIRLVNYDNKHLAMISFDASGKLKLTEFSDAFGKSKSKEFIIINYGEVNNYVERSIYDKLLFTYIFYDLVNFINHKLKKEAVFNKIITNENNIINTINFLEKITVESIDSLLIDMFVYHFIGNIQDMINKYKIPNIDNNYKITTSVNSKYKIVFGIYENNKNNKKNIQICGDFKITRSINNYGLILLLNNKKIISLQEGENIKYHKSNSNRKLFAPVEKTFIEIMKNLMNNLYIFLINIYHAGGYVYRKIFLKNSDINKMKIIFNDDDSIGDERFKKYINLLSNSNIIINNIMLANDIKKKDKNNNKHMKKYMLKTLSLSSLQTL